MPESYEENFDIAPQMDTVPGASGRFGYDPTNPIPVADVQGQCDYLARLYCDCGTAFSFHRYQSTGSGPDGHHVDEYELICSHRVHHFKLYLDLYHAGPSYETPEGLTRGPRLGIGTSSRVDNFPDGLLGG